MSHKLVNLIIELKQSCRDTEKSITDKMGITGAEYHCLKIIPVAASLGCSELAESMNLSPSRASRIIDGMVDKKLLERKIAEDDRRRNELNLTEKGRRIKKQIDQELNDCENLLKNNLSEQQIDLASSGIEAILQVLRNGQEDR